jgi:selenide,water dikinase
MNEYLLTQYSHGAGCGCKLSPRVLESIVKTFDAVKHFPNLLVGNEGRDDASVFRINESQAVISTTDFFMPIVDDAFDFGRIASANAISDVYAMGGTPLMAIAILGWPIDKLPAEVAARVLDGSRAICAEAGIPLAGGHSIDSPEPIFGLAVTGIVHPDKILRNKGAREGDLLYLTKPIGVGILATAQKKGLADAAAREAATRSMVQLNRLGQDLGTVPGLHALTDVTGFGLLGHLEEICDASGLSADVFFPLVPRLAEAETYLHQKAIPGGTRRNLDSFGAGISGGTEEQRFWLADPQTSGGLLLALDPAEQKSFESWALTKGHLLRPFGKMRSRAAFSIRVLDDPLL